MPSHLLHMFRVGSWKVEPLRGAITDSEGKVHHLEPKVMDVFVCLAEHANELVTRDELLRAVWGEHAVSDEPLTRAIGELRKALHENRGRPQHIETIPKRGYRLIGQIALAENASESTAIDGQEPEFEAGTRDRRSASDHRAWLAGVAAIIAIGTTMLVMRDMVLDPSVQNTNSGLSTGIPENSIAVMPFTSCLNDENNQLLALGIGDEVRSRLAQVDDVMVSARSTKPLSIMARASSLVLAESGFDPELISKSLRVQFLLNGEICRHGAVLSTTVTLIDNNGYLAWSQDFEQIDDSAGKLSNSLPQTIANAVTARMGGSPARAMQDPIDRLALDNLIIGRQYRDRGNVEKARIAFEKALLLQPELPEAILELALLEFSGLGLNIGTELKNAKQLAEYALNLALKQLQRKPRSFHLNLITGRMISLITSWEEDLVWRNSTSGAGKSVWEKHAEAEAYLSTASEINPSSTLASEWLANAIEAQGRAAEALRILEQALARDPFNINLNWKIAKRWAARDRYYDAIELLQRFEQLPEVPEIAWWGQLELMQLHTFWDQKCETLIKILQSNPDAFAHDGIRAHASWFISDLLYLGLNEEAEVWRQRLDRMPLPDWAQFFFRERFNLWAADREDELIDDTRARLAAMTDEEIMNAWYEMPLNWAFDLAIGGETERAIELMERIHHAPGTWAERDMLGSILLAEMYYEVNRNEDANSLLMRVLDNLESEVASGIRHPQTLYQLAWAYALQSRDDEAFQALQMAVDMHWSKPFWKLPWRSVYEQLADDSRMAVIRRQVEDDLQNQAARIRLMLADHEPDNLLAPLMSKAQ